MKLSDKFKVDEDSAVPAQDQILERINFEANHDWAKNTDLSKRDLNKYYKELGEHFKSKTI